MRLVILVCMALLLCVTACSGVDYPDFKDLAADFDAKAHLEIGGANGERFVSSGPDYDRVQEVANKLLCEFPVFVVNDNSFNAAASTSRIYVNTGAVRRCSNDDLLAPILGHEMIHVLRHHLEGQYDKQVRDAKQLDKAIQAVNKPGYRENAEIAAKVGGVLADIFSLQYSRDDEYDADVEGFKLAKTAGYDPEVGLGIFSMMGKGFTGILGNLSSHPASDARKERIIEDIEREKVADEARKLTLKAVGGIEAVDSTDLATIIRDRSFTGFAHRMLANGNCLYLLCKGEGELPYNKKMSTVTLPAGTKEVFIVGVNPKPANFMGQLNFTIVPGYESIYKMDTKDSHLDSLAARVPVEVFQAGLQFRIILVLGTVPVPAGQSHDVTKITSRDCTIGFEKDPADLVASRVSKMKDLFKLVKVGSADALLQFQLDVGEKFPGYTAKSFDGLFDILVDSHSAIVLKKNVLQLPRDTKKVRIIFRNQKDSLGDMNIELTSKPESIPIKLKGKSGIKGLVVILPPEFLYLSDEITLKSRFWKDAEGKDAEEKQITLKVIR